MAEKNASEVKEIDNCALMAEENTSEVKEIDNCALMAEENTSEVKEIENFALMAEENASAVKEIENCSDTKENTSEVKEIENCSDTNPLAMSEEGSVETELVKDVEDVISVASKGQEECVSETSEVTKPPSVSSRRHSTGATGTRAGKPQVQSRYRGNHHVSSIHDLCKHGKRCVKDDAVKPWKVLRIKSVEGSETVINETSGLRKKSLGSASRQIPSTKPEIYVAAKRDALFVKKKLCASVNSETSSEMARSVDGSSVTSNDKARKNKGTESTLSGSAIVKKVVPGLRNDKSNSAMNKVPRISDAESSKVSAPKNLRNKEKAKTQTSSGEDVKEKIVCVVEASVKGVQSEKQASSEKKTMRSGLISLTTPKRGSAYHSPAKQVPGKISTALTKKKESDDADLEANQKPEKKIRPKMTGVKVTQAKQLSFKKGKTLEPKPEDASPKWIKFRKRVMQEPKPQSEGRKKNLKGVETKSDSCEGSKREKVVLRHRNVEGKKKMMTLFNNVIEETMIKLTKVRKTKVKALIGAFETVISLQDTKTPQRVQCKAATSASKVSPLGPEQ